MSLLLNLQCSFQITDSNRTTPRDSQHSHVQTLSDSEQQLDSTMECMALKELENAVVLCLIEIKIVHLVLVS